MPDEFFFKENRRSGRAMHALVIGVGRYPHLLGGDPATTPTTSHDGMGQLTSPPVSARKIADWLLHDFHHPDYPRHTVTMLLTEKDPTPYAAPGSAPVDVPSATFDNIQAAVHAWRDLGDEHVDDLLIFYFCGHGISEGHSMVLLPSDFGSTDNAYSHSIDFLNLYDGMNQYKAARQCFFVDACRTSSDTLKGNSGRSLLQVRPRTADGVRVAPIYYATLRGAASHGRVNKPSVFAEAMLSSVRHFAATDDEGVDDWRVSNFRLAEALDHMMSRARTNNELPVQVPQGVAVNSQFYINHLTRRPNANLYVSADPPDSLKELKYTPEDGSPSTDAERSVGDEWALTVPTGNVRLSWRANGQPESRTVPARPIFRKLRLDLS